VDWDVDNKGTTCTDNADVCGTVLPIATKGIVTFDSFTLSCSIGEKIDLSFFTTSNLVENIIHVIFEFGICVRGQVYYKTDDICLTCAEGTYRLDVFTDENLENITTCNSCPAHAVCQKDNVTADPGYWKVTYYDDEIMKCPYGEAACKGGADGGDASCNEGNKCIYADIMMFFELNGCVCTYRIHGSFLRSVCRKLLL
jgi:hypothetical protein